MNNRIKFIRKSLSMSQKEFCEKIGITRSSLSLMELNKSPILERTVILICSQFNVNENWLRTGKGEMFNISDKNYQELFEIYEQLHKPFQNFLKRTAQNLLDTQKNLEKNIINQ